MDAIIELRLLQRQSGRTQKLHELCVMFHLTEKPNWWSRTRNVSTGVWSGSGHQGFAQV